MNSMSLWGDEKKVLTKAIQETVKSTKTMIRYAAYRKAQKNLEIERTEANLAAFKEARKVMLSTPHLDEMDENYKRLQYNRYADDFLISITGSKQDAENIKEQVKIFLKDKLNLTMSEEKTHVYPFL